ncbi:cytochrome c oxidase subunit 2A [Macrococcus animalis]|uniref:cytochrome c oxidase subunit 2A n=1 Tax=Macrococcus animalis TaxID=3395467 RepID=UPI0039BF65E1
MAEDKNLNRSLDPVQANEDAHHDLDLRGTLVSVLVIGGVILVSWFAIFILFLERI